MHEPSLASLPISFGTIRMHFYECADADKNFKKLNLGCDKCDVCKPCTGCIACLTGSCDDYAKCEDCKYFTPCLKNPELPGCEMGKDCLKCAPALACFKDIWSVVKELYQPCNECFDKCSECAHCAHCVDNEKGLNLNFLLFQRKHRYLAAIMRTSSVQIIT
jgi:hypothetical protein